MPKQLTRRVEICGGIAAGKTTLARVLRSRELAPVYEDFKKNPFYLAFYKDPIGTAFEAELTFLLQHYHQQKLMILYNRGFCADFSLVLDRAYASVTLEDEDQHLFHAVYARVEQKLPPRSLLVWLRCSAELELQRIKRRHRRAERGITTDYLRRITDALATNIRKIRRNEKVLVLDSNAINFATDPSAQVYVRRQIAEALESAT